MEISITGGGAGLEFLIEEAYTSSTWQASRAPVQPTLLNAIKVVKLYKSI